MKFIYLNVVTGIKDYQNLLFNQQILMIILIWELFLVLIGLDETDYTKYPYDGTI